MKLSIYTLGTGLIISAPVFAQSIPSSDVFNQCQNCHIISPEVVAIDEWVGPNLFGIIGRQIAAVDGFEYSDNLYVAGKNGGVWDQETLDAFLKDPTALYPNTSMSFGGIENDKERAALIAFLKLEDDKMIALNGDPKVSEEILAIEGDLAYGEYLSSTCVTCHQVNGEGTGIPPIIGWSIKRFVTVMHAYKNKHRENPIMQQYAGSLSDDEIAALAVYFKGLGNEKP